MTKKSKFIKDNAKSLAVDAKKAAEDAKYYKDRL